MPEKAAPPKTKVCCPGCKRPLGDVFESIVRQRGRFKSQRETARKERDRYRATLEILADESNWNGNPSSSTSSLYGHFTPYELARRALKESDEAQSGTVRP